MSAVLIVGSGAREHALAWKLHLSPGVQSLYVAPGNAGTATLAQNVPVAATDVEGLARLVEERDIALTVVGPEAPLALGLVDRLRAAGRRVVGPERSAARIEWSKAFAKDLMRRTGVPTARYMVADEPAIAFRRLAESDYPLVVKADGLAAGKGVVVCRDIGEARRAVEAIMVERVHGTAGERIVLEEALTGPEVSLLALVDGERIVPLPLAQDHKRLCDGDAGPNTGGMGAYAPVGLLERSRYGELVDLTVRPVVEALARMGKPYRGVLFAGLMLTDEGPKVLEYNCRLGDPEAQVVLPLLTGDLLPWLEAVAGGELEDDAPHWSGAAVGVVLATPGYPESPQMGAVIEGLDRVGEDVVVFHGGTARDDSGRVVTSGGRVVTVVGRGEDVQQAAQRAYACPVRFEGMQRRRDIARQARRFTPPPSRRRIAVLASGGGTNLQALIDACAAGAVRAEVSLVLSHDADAHALERARAAGIPACVVPMGSRHDGADRRCGEERLLEVLRRSRPDLIVLAGWMRILSAEFLERCGAPLINVHPALLDPPDGFPVLRGAHAVRDALALNLPRTGVSVHYVTPEVDAGPVIATEPVRILPDDDENRLYARIKPVEHRLLVDAVNHCLLQPTRGGVHA